MLTPLKKASARGRGLGLAVAAATGLGLLQASSASAQAPADEARQVQAQMALGKLLFTKNATPACALCHTLKDAQSEGAVGPVLDEIKPDADRVTRALRNGLGNMPAFPQLSEAEIKALSVYVSRAAK